MSTIATDAPSVQSSPNGETLSVGQWGELPPQDKKNGPNSKFAPELNATAREQGDHVDQNGKPLARVISVQKSVRAASGRASTIKRKLRSGTVNGLEFPAENFTIVARGSIVYAVYDAAKAEAKAEPKPKGKPEAKPGEREAAPDPKPRASRK